MNKVMKKISKVIAVLMLTAGSFTVSAQPPPPPNGGPGGGGGDTEDALGGGAPIGGGLFILLGLGAAYGGRKLYQLKAKDLKE